MKIRRFLTFPALLLIAMTGHAGLPDFGCTFTKPKICPSVTAIKAGSVGTGIVFLNNQYYAGRRHYDYGTGDLWTFIIGPLPATSKAEAYSKALSELPNLKFLFGPQCSPMHDWACAYVTDDGIPAVAATPPLKTLQLAPSLLK